MNPYCICNPIHTTRAFDSPFTPYIVGCVSRSLGFYDHTTGEIIEGKVQRNIFIGTRIYTLLPPVIVNCHFSGLIQMNYEKDPLIGWIAYWYRHNGFLRADIVPNPSYHKENEEIQEILLPVIKNVLHTNFSPMCLKKYWI